MPDEDAPLTAAPGSRAAGGRRRKILAALAAHPDGLTSRQLAGLHGEDTGQRMLTRYGKALRALRDAGYAAAAGTVQSGRQNTPAIVYQITDAGRDRLAAIEAPRPEPPERQRAGYPWVEDAARRNHAGESVNALGRDYKVGPQTLKRAVERRGFLVLQHVSRSPRPPRPQPEWAAEAARRYRDGEPRSALCAAYAVSDRVMARVLKAEGVDLRGLREALQLRASLARQMPPARREALSPASRPGGPPGAYIPLERSMMMEAEPAARGGAVKRQQDTAGCDTLDTSKPNIARVYDYWLGGKDNFAADREEAERMLRIYPPVARLVRDNRLFLGRAVTWVAQQGIRQFLDVGSGLPTRDNTHQAAQAVDPSCRVVYVDNDPVVLAHAQARLAAPGVEAIAGDLREPMWILGDPVVCKLIRPDEPACVVLACVLHFFPFETAREIASAVIRWLPPGSYVMISAGCGDEETGNELIREYKAAPVYNHSLEQIEKFFGGLPLVPPGLVDAGDWCPGGTVIPSGHRGGRILAGIGCKAGARRAGTR